MARPWRINAEKWLMQTESPFVLTAASLRLLTSDRATIGDGQAPSDATFYRWLRDMSDAGKLVEVTKGVYLNRLGHRNQSAAAAAAFVRRGAVLSLSWVLEQAGLMNNFGETFTCTIPTLPGASPPQIKDRVVPGIGTFRFHALRIEKAEPTRARRQDIYDPGFGYLRATPEKALLDWICLSGDGRSRLRRPPLDIRVDELDHRRLKRLCRAMDIEDDCEAWLAQWRQYQQDPEVEANAPRFDIG